MPSKTQSISLKDNLQLLKGIGPKTARILNQHQLYTIEDLITYYPRTYHTYQPTTINQLQNQTQVVIKGKLKNITQSRKGKLTLQKAILQDETGIVTLRWFNQPFLLRTLKPNTFYLVKGQTNQFRHQIQLLNPQLAPIQANTSLKTIIEPIYSQMDQLKSSWFKRIIHQLLTNHQLHLPENLPSSLLDQYQLLTRDQALTYIHQPPTLDLLNQARHRLAFEELYFLQLQSLQLKSLHRPQTQAFQIQPHHFDQFLQSLPFNLTPSQKKAIQEISQDLSQPKAMNRLLMGDVGSGKTVVAAFAAYLTALNQKLTYVMAPTQVLAEQLFHRFQTFLSPHHIAVALMTGNTKPQSDYQVLIGTHALLYHQLPPQLGLVIIDEQHKFGVEQRQQLLQLQPSPHQLLMSATPIPRTLALTLMSHLDISFLKDKPAFKKPIKTFLVPETKRQAAYDWIKTKISQENYQVFVVTPLIEESDNQAFSHLKSATQVTQELTHIFAPHQVALLHGQLPPQQKQAIVNDFAQGKIKILVSTTVIEVGIDIPQANIILIESAERFGLAQLHQLRGRVGRSTQQGYCLLFTHQLTPKAKARLEALVKHQDGALLAELDMKLRGPGEIWGTQQHGFFQLKLANIFDTKLVKDTYQAAKQVLDLSTQPT